MSEFSSQNHNAHRAIQVAISLLHLDELQRGILVIIGAFYARVLPVCPAALTENAHFVTRVSGCVGVSLLSVCCIKALRDLDNEVL